jgi:AcrR family transcriptional regulator
MESTEVSTKRADAATNRARIIEVGQSVFAECGLEMEINEVAARAHLGVGTLYRHFGNREDLLRAIVQRAAEDALTQMKAALASAPDDPRASLQALVLSSLRVQQQYRPLFAVIRDPRLKKILDPSYGQAIHAQFREMVGDMIKHGIEAGVFRDDLDTEMVAVTILGSFACAFDLLGTHYSFDELAQRLSRHLLTMFTEKAKE